MNKIDAEVVEKIKHLCGELNKIAKDEIVSPWSEILRVDWCSGEVRKLETSLCQAVRAANAWVDMPSERRTLIQEMAASNNFFFGSGGHHRPSIKQVLYLRTPEEQEAYEAKKALRRCTDLTRKGRRCSAYVTEEDFDSGSRVCRIHRKMAKREAQYPSGDNVLSGVV